MGVNLRGQRRMKSLLIFLLTFYGAFVFAEDGEKLSQEKANRIAAVTCAVKHGIWMGQFVLET